MACPFLKLLFFPNPVGKVAVQHSTSLHDLFFKTITSASATSIGFSNYLVQKKTITGATFS